MSWGAAIVLLVVSLVRSGVPSGIGRCPKHEYMRDFNISKFTGQWYEVERSFYLMELASTCMTVDLKEKDNGQVEVAVTTFGRWTGLPKETRGTATKSKKDASLFLHRVNSKLPTPVARLLPGAGFYQILDTDYDNYAILWTCSSAVIAHSDFIWILGRSRDIDVHLRARIYDFLTARHIDSERLIISRNNCTFDQ